MLAFLCMVNRSLVSTRNCGELGESNVRTSNHDMEEGDCNIMSFVSWGGRLTRTRGGKG